MTNIVKNHSNPELLKYYNKKSTSQLIGIIDSKLFKLSNTSFSVINKGIDLANSVPLQSNDALIAAAAADKSGNILTFDNDFKKVTIVDPNNKREVECFTVKTPNNYYLKRNRAGTRMDELDENLKMVIELTVGGPQKFKTKFRTL